MHDLDPAECIMKLESNDRLGCFPVSRAHKVKKKVLCVQVWPDLPGRGMKIAVDSKIQPLDIVWKCRI